MRRGVGVRFGRTLHVALVLSAHMRRCRDMPHRPRMHPRRGDLPVKPASIAVVAAACTLATAARAQDLPQDNQVMFGVMGSYVPHQNNLPGDVAAIGHYVSFSHSFDFVYLGMRVAILYGWLPSGLPGQQYLIEPDIFIGVHGKIKPVTLRLELGTGPLVNGGEGFSTQTMNHSYLRGAAQLTVVKSVTVEAFAGPSLVVGAYVAGIFAEMGLGVGWNF
jgi:hypothetical protein